jgi:hypothetical protein
MFPADYVIYAEKICADPRNLGEIKQFYNRMLLLRNRIEGKHGNWN